MSACDLAALIRRKMIGVDIGSQSILVIKDGERIVATERACPHEGADLAMGRCAAGRLHCARHQASFDLTDGEVSSGWDFRALRLYPVRISDGQIWVDLGDQR